MIVKLSLFLVAQPDLFRQQLLKVSIVLSLLKDFKILGEKTQGHFFTNNSTPFDNL